MAKFRTKYDRLDLYSNAGTPFRNTYKFDNDKDGKRILVKSGRDNIYDAIQAEFESADLHHILERYNRGEISDLNMRTGIYADLTQIPTNIFQMAQLVDQAHLSFNKLPVDVRSKFDNSPTQFLKEFGSEHFKEVMSDFYSVKEEVKTQPIQAESEVE